MSLFLSMILTLWPFLTHSIAAVKPARPVPTIKTSMPDFGYEPKGLATEPSGAIDPKFTRD